MRYCHKCPFDPNHGSDSVSAAAAIKSGLTVLAGDSTPNCSSEPGSECESLVFLARQARSARWTSERSLRNLATYGLQKMAVFHDRTKPAEQRWHAASQVASVLGLVEHNRMLIGMNDRILSFVANQSGWNAYVFKTMGA